MMNSVRFYSRLKRGFALVLSLFLVLVLYTGMTIMMANLRSDLRMSGQAFQTTQSRFASQGAVNKLYALLQGGASPLDYTSDDPLEVDVGDFKKVKAWVVEDDDTGVYHLYSEFNGVPYNRVVTRKSDGEARTYINTEGTLFSAGVDDSAWVPLPEPPQKVYNHLGELIDCMEMKCEFYPNANSDGRLAALYSGTNNTGNGVDDGRAIYLWDEGSQSWSDVTPPNLSHAPAVTIAQLPLEFNSVSLGEDRLYYYDHDLAVKSSVVYYDLDTQTWSEPVPGPFDGEGILAGFMDQEGHFVAQVRHDGTNHAMRLVEGVWSELPPLPGNVELGTLKPNGPEGELYATGSNGQLYKMEGDTWSVMDVAFNPEKLFGVDASGALIAYDEESDTMYRWEDSDAEPKPLPESDGDLWGLTGGGTKEAQTGSDGYQTTATF
jgi:hypothetical protein